MRIEEKLKEEHDEVENKLEKIIDSDNRRKQEKLFDEVSESILKHVEAEEKAYYQKIREDLDEDPELDESKQEHIYAKRIIKDIKSISVSSDEWVAKVKVLKENLQHHHNEEEDDFFAKTKQKYSDEQAEKMASDFEDHKKRISV